MLQKAYCKVYMDALSDLGLYYMSFIFNLKRQNSLWVDKQI